MANGLETMVPMYEEFTVASFDSDRVHEELIKSNWDWFATEWVALSKLAASATAMNTSFTRGLR